MISRTVLAAILIMGVLATPLHARAQDPVRASKDRVVRTNFKADSTRKSAERYANREVRKWNRRARKRTGIRDGDARRTTRPFRLSSLVPTSAAKARRGTRIYSRGRYLGRVVVPFRRKLKPGTIYVNNRRLPEVMEGGPENPLGARALYIGNTLYRIHGTNNPRSIGRNVSSGCIRMVNDDVIDLYDRVKVGAKVIVE